MPYLCPPGAPPGLIAALLVNSRVPTQRLRNIVIGLRDTQAGLSRQKHGPHMIGRCKGKAGQNFDAVFHRRTHLSRGLRYSSIWLHHSSSKLSKRGISSGFWFTLCFPGGRQGALWWRRGGGAVCLLYCANLEKDLPRSIHRRALRVQSGFDIYSMLFVSSRKF